MRNDSIVDLTVAQPARRAGFTELYSSYLLGCLVSPGTCSHNYF